MRIANYARKSIFSDKSDSVENQCKLGDEYIRKHFNVKEIFYYVDNGETGANTNRPGYNRLMSDIEVGLIDVVVVYKIDRISRDVDDFSTLFKYLTSKHIIFVSITDNVDTSNAMMPVEKAMMFLSSVFSQFERETIVQRVTDNMLALAESGYWAGGKPPIGFSTQRITTNGKSHVILTENHGEIPFLNMIADTFMTGFSLNGLETYFRNNGIRTMKDNYLSSSQLYGILKNPHYAPADSTTYEYFKSLGCRMAAPKELFDGSHGLLVYGRTKGSKKKKHTAQSPDKWTVSVGRHAPLWTTDKWLSIQNRFGQNKIDKTRKHNIGILKGVVRCKCGCLMRVQHKIDKTYNKIYDNYFCQQRNYKGKDFCDISFVSVATLDGSLIETLKKIYLDQDMIDNYIAPANYNPLLRDKNLVKKEIDLITRKIENLTAALSDSVGSVASKYIVSDIEKFDNRLSTLNLELREICMKEQKIIKHKVDKTSKYNTVCDIVKCIDTADYEEINSLLKDFLLECVWDGFTLHIKI